MEDKPTHYPNKQHNGHPLKPITQVLLDRRATPHFTTDPVPDDFLEAILTFGGQARCRRPSQHRQPRTSRQ